MSEKEAVRPQEWTLYVCPFCGREYVREGVCRGWADEDHEASAAGLLEPVRVVPAEWRTVAEELGESLRGIVDALGGGGEELYGSESTIANSLPSSPPHSREEADGG